VILTDSIIDYAGLFPPAGLTMDKAVGNYAEYRAGEWCRLLGRFIVPASRLAEMEAALNKSRRKVRETLPWRISALVGDDPESDLRSIRDFNNRNDPFFTIDTLELNVPELEELSRVQQLCGGMPTYWELAVDERLEAFLSGLAKGGGRAKIRTGGVREGMTPAADRLARFILECAKKSLSFKATAGLHHALHSGTMHGFLNVAAAAAFALEGADAATLKAIIEEEKHDAFSFESGEITWRGKRITGDRLRRTRLFFVSFGSCSFEEPVAELRALGLL